MLREEGTPRFQGTSRTQTHFCDALPALPSGVIPRVTDPSALPSCSCCFDADCARQCVPTFAGSLINKCALVCRWVHFEALTVGRLRLMVTRQSSNSLLIHLSCITSFLKQPETQLLDTQKTVPQDRRLQELMGFQLRRVDW